MVERDRSVASYFDRIYNRDINTSYYERRRIYGTRKENNKAN